MSETPAKDAPLDAAFIGQAHGAKDGGKGKTDKSEEHNTKRWRMRGIRFARLAPINAALLTPIA